MGMNTMSHFPHYIRSPLDSGDVLWSAMDTAICNSWANTLTEVLKAGKENVFLIKSVPRGQVRTLPWWAGSSQLFPSKSWGNPPLSFAAVRLDTQLKPDQPCWEQLHVEPMKNFHSWCHGHFVMDPWNSDQGAWNKQLTDIHDGSSCLPNYWEPPSQIWSPIVSIYVDHKYFALGAHYKRSI